MTNRQQVKLGDICEITSSKRIFMADYVDSGIPFYRSKEIIEKQRGNNISTELFITEEKYEEIKQKFSVPQEGDILLTSVGTLGIPYIVRENEKFYFKDGNLTWIKKSKNFLPEYLYYYLISDEGKFKLENISIGTTQKAITIVGLKSLEIFLPPIDVQKKIAGVLGALDDKIELNNKINNNLEQQAQALFNEKILNNPKQGCIGDYCSIKSGFAFKSSWWQNSGVRVIKIKNIESSELNLHECSYVSEDKISIAKDFVVKGGDLLIAMTGATIGKFAIVPHVDEILLVNQRVGKFFLGDNPLEKLPFIYCTLKQPEVVSEIINRGQGSAQPNISGNDIMSITCTYPDENIIANFNNICRPYFEKIITNQYENTRLAALRDTLLPKLMSGEVDVSNVDISALTSTDKLSFTED